MILTFINFNSLEGDELDQAFEKFMRENGVTDDDEFNVAPIRSITGHTAYLCSVEKGAVSTLNPPKSKAESQESTPNKQRNVISK